MRLASNLWDVMKQNECRTAPMLSSIPLFASHKLRGFAALGLSQMDASQRDEADTQVHTVRLTSSQWWALV